MRAYGPRGREKFGPSMGLTLRFATGYAQIRSCGFVESLRAHHFFPLRWRHPWRDFIPCITPRLALLGQAFAVSEPATGRFKARPLTRAHHFLPALIPLLSWWRHPWRDLTCRMTPRLSRHGQAGASEPATGTFKAGPLTLSADGDGPAQVDASSGSVHASVDFTNALSHA